VKAEEAIKHVEQQTICHQLTTLIETFNKLSATGSTLNSSQVQINPRPLEDHQQRNNNPERRPPQKRLSASQRLHIAIQARLTNNNCQVARDFGITEGAVRKCLKIMKKHVKESSSKRPPGVRGPGHGKQAGLLSKGD